MVRRNRFFKLCYLQGDVQENVISNIMKGSGVLDLSGMTEESVVNGVKVCI